MPQRKKSHLGRYTKAAQRKRDLRKKLKLKQLNEMKEKDYKYHSHMLLNYHDDMNYEMNIGQYSHVDSIDSLTNRETKYLSEEKQDFLGFCKNVTFTDIPIVKTEILDPSEQCQELVLPDYPQHTTIIDPMCVVETEIQDSSETNSRPLLSNIKVEYTDIEESMNELPRIEKTFESNINLGIQNCLISNYKISQCYVLLYDCLIPENLASILANHKSLKINTDISAQFFPLSDSPFFGHISEDYRKLAFSKDYKMILFEKEKKSRLFSRVCPNKERKKRGYSDKSKCICNCFKTPDDDMITIKSECDVNNSEPTQQLCSCATSDFTMKPAEMHMQEILFDPDFGKISCGLNKMDYDF